MPTPTLDQLRRYALARSLFKPTTLPQAIKRLGFVQADPIRAPARAQDLTLRHRVTGYRAGELERRYPRLPIEEDFFINYGFLPRSTQALMHPRTARTEWPAARWQQAAEVLAFVRAHGTVHPRQVDAAFAHGKSRNWFGGNSNASTQLLDGMHYRGLLRIARREGGVRLYAVAPEREIAADPDLVMDQLVDVLLAKYAPLPERSMTGLIHHLRGGAPQWEALRHGAIQRAKARLPSASVDGQRWYWPAGENPRSTRHTVQATVRLLAPFDPVVWDRRRFEAFWGWAYRFEAYTPATRRVRGYYALPLLWHEQVLGWANLALREGQLQTEVGFVSRRPRGAAFRLALEEELAAMQQFLGV